MNNHGHIEHILDEILAQHIECNKKLLELIRRERQYIIHNELEALDGVNNEKLSLKDAIAMLETRRASLLPQFIKQYGLSKGHVRLEDILQAVPEPYKRQYKEKQGILRDLLRRIKITHDGNKMLIERTLSFQERSFMLLFGLTRQHVRYGSAGDVQHDQKHLFDSKA